MTTVAIVTPSRGLIHSRTVESVLRLMASTPGVTFAGWFFTHDLPAPDAQNTAFGRALDSGADYLLSVEEDNLLPEGTLAAMLALLQQGYDVAFLDYPVGWPQTSHCYYQDGDQVAWCGLGSTLISRRVFEALPRPWFRIDQQIEYVRFGTSGVSRKTIVERQCVYGGFDILFMHAATQAGFRIGVIPAFTGGHCWLEQWGDKTTNAGGPHQVVIRTQFNWRPGLMGGIVREPA